MVKKRYKHVVAVMGEGRWGDQLLEFAYNNPDTLVIGVDSPHIIEESKRNLLDRLYIMTKLREMKNKEALRILKNPRAMIQQLEFMRQKLGWKGAPEGKVSIPSNIKLVGGNLENLRTLGRESVNWAELSFGGPFSRKVARNLGAWIRPGGTALFRGLDVKNREELAKELERRGFKVMLGTRDIRKVKTPISLWEDYAKEKRINYTMMLARKPKSRRRGKR